MSDLNSSTFRIVEDRQNAINCSCLVLQYGDITSVYLSDNSSVKQTGFWMSVIATSIMIIVITFVGIPGNVLNALVFYRLGLRERINLCLFALAVVNIVYMLAKLLGSAEVLYGQTIKPLWAVQPYTNCASGAEWASQFLSAVIASERCFCVVSPFHAKRLLKTSTMAAIIVVCSVLLTGGMCAIAGPKHRLVCVFHPDTKVTEQIEYVTEPGTFLTVLSTGPEAPMCSQNFYVPVAATCAQHSVGVLASNGHMGKYFTEYYLQNRRILDIFDIYVYAIALSGIFLFITIVTTIITAVKVRDAIAWRLTKTTTVATTTQSDSDERLSSKEVNMTLMLMASSIMFIVCITANLIIQICRVTVPGFTYEGLYITLITAAWNIVYLSWSLNSSLHFLVYYKMGSKFREEVRAMIGLKK